MKPLCRCKEVVAAATVMESFLDNVQNITNH